MIACKEFSAVTPQVTKWDSAMLVGGIRMLIMMVPYSQSAGTKCTKLCVVAQLSLSSRQMHTGMNLAWHGPVLIRHYWLMRP